ncbi:MAG: YggN family protein [candidate division Zixibacteria bacterium]|nr:YggN family protein [candidate division Zixibacteria bacterium]
MAKSILRHRAGLIWLFVGLLALPLSAWAGSKSNEASDSYVTWDTYHHDDISVKIKKDGTLQIRHKGRDRTRVEITSDYDLYIGGKKIVTNDRQEELLAQFYGLTMDVRVQAMEIGKEGAKIGLEGAKLGLSAIGRVFKLLSSNYDTDDLEREMERDAEKLELKAEKLEEKADQIEELVDELEYIADDLRAEIPELRELNWF